MPMPSTPPGQLEFLEYRAGLAREGLREIDGIDEAIEATC
jgi:hypothetical protein